jgi:hypothetical protein
MYRNLILAAAALLTAPLVPAAAPAAEAVTLDTYARAESDAQMQGYVESYDAFGRFDHFRTLYDVENQITVRGNRDTLYSVGVFDLTEPLTITLPETGDRFQSLLVVSQDHDVFPAIYEAGPHDFTRDGIGTRYMFAIVRTFANPDDPADMEAAHAAQDGVLVAQTDPGALELPDWDLARMRAMRDALNVLGAGIRNTAPFFGMQDEIDRLDHMLGVTPEKNDGKTPHALTVRDVPVDGFWSVTLYDAEGFMPVNNRGVYSFNDVTATPDPDGAYTIHFGACGDGRSNCLPIVAGWNYLVRLYRPRPEILDGSWIFPPAEPVE